MPADTGADVIFCKEDVPDRPRTYACEAFRAGEDLANEIRNWLGLVQPTVTVIITEAKRGDAALAFEWAELEWGKRQLAHGSDQRALLHRRNEIGLIAEPLRPRVLLFEKGELPRHRMLRLLRRQRCGLNA